MSSGSVPEILVSEWVSYTRASSISLIEKCLKMSQVLETPDMDIDHYMGVIREDSLRYGYDIRVLQRAGYTVADKSGTVLSNLLDKVIDTRCGSSLSLAIIHQQMASRSGVRAAVVSGADAPLIRGESFCVDVMGGAAKGIDTDRTPGTKALFEEHILRSMLTVLKKAYLKTAQYDRALMCIDMAAGIKMTMPEDHRDTGLILYRTGDKKAVWWLKKYLRENPDADDSAAVSGLVDFLDTD